MALLILSGPACVWAGAVPAPQAPVADYAGVIPSSAEQQLNRYLLELQQKTGAQLWVLTIDTTGGVPIRDFATDLVEKWKIGQEGKDNGVLMLVAVKDRKYTIEVGYGLEGALPDAYCANMARAYFVPYFKRGQFGQGLSLAVLEMTDTIAKEYGVEITGLTAPRLARRTRADSGRHMRRATGGLCSMVFPMLVMVLVFSSIRRRRGLSGWALPMLFGMAMGSSHRRSSWGGGFGGSGFGSFGGGFGGGGGGSFGGGGASGGW
ncbi:MAG: TPM domain-containing protein [Phycisphaerae bacterium]|nr:TPM domain-containing protein [Phycisphaerae bacterium]